MTTPVLPEEDPFDVIQLFLPPEAEPVQCEGCDAVFREDEVFDGLCHDCYFISDEDELADLEYEAWLAEQADRENDDQKLGL